MILRGGDLGDHISGGTSSLLLYVACCGQARYCGIRRRAGSSGSATSSTPAASKHLKGAIWDSAICQVNQCPTVQLNSACLTVGTSAQVYGDSVYLPFPTRPPACPYSGEFSPYGANPPSWLAGPPGPLTCHWHPQAKSPAPYPRQTLSPGPYPRLPPRRQGPAYPQQRSNLALLRERPRQQQAEGCCCCCRAYGLPRSPMTPRPDPRRLLTPPRDRGWYHHRGRPPRQQHSTTENPIISAAKQNDTNCSGSTTPQDYSSMIAPIDNSKYTTSRILNTNYVHKAFPVIILP